MEKIFIIIGTSGTGKSTICKELREKYPDFAVHDIDEDGVPSEPTVSWREKQTNILLEKAKGYQKQGKTVVLCGVMVPSEIKKSKVYDNTLNIHYIFLHLNKEIVASRLKSRNYPQDKIDDNLNWSEYLENLVRQEYNYSIIDVTDKNKGNVFAEVSELIK